MNFRKKLTKFLIWLRISKNTASSYEFTANKYLKYRIEPGNPNHKAIKLTSTPTDTICSSTLKHYYPIE